MGSLTLGPDRSGRVVAIVDGHIAATPAPGAAVIACADGTIEAGAVCAHTHLYSGLAALGMPSPRPAPTTFVEILERVWWRLDRALDADSLAAAARLSVAEALLAGTTTLIDHHESPALIEGSLAVLAGACDDLGVRALLCYGATERNGGRDEARRGLAECARVPTSPLIRPLVGLHASFTVSDETIREAGDRARDLGTVLHVHLAEAQADVADAEARGYAGPLARLVACDAVVPGSIFAHGVHLTAADVDEIDARGCWLVQNPRSNEGNGVGYPAMLARSDRVALGTDGWPADMAVEAQALARLAAAHGDAHAGGRLAAGAALVAERFGVVATGLAPGALGDVVVRDGGAIRQVVVGGRWVVRDGRLVGADLDDIRRTAERESRRLWARMAAL
ncbi:amidohydrolase family protein [Siculibacillus lacustris]|nr:amidohydrolase family protein [Siculibacillus lacustris]